jgi:hypothetical protein
LSGPRHLRKRFPPPLDAWRPYPHLGESNLIGVVGRVSTTAIRLALAPWFIACQVSNARGIGRCEVGAIGCHGAMLSRPFRAWSSPPGRRGPRKHASPWTEVPCSATQRIATTSAAPGTRLGASMLSRPTCPGWPIRPPKAAKAWHPTLPSSTRGYQSLKCSQPLRQPGMG